MAITSHCAGRRRSRDGSRFLFSIWIARVTGRSSRLRWRRYPGPGQNFVYADVDGNIGYQAAGMLPIRKNYDGDVPVDGASGDFEWDGFIPFDQLPSFYNPPRGWIVTANQNPFPENYPYPRERRFWRAVSLERDSGPAARARLVGSRKKCWPCRRTFTPRFRVSWRARLWRPTIARRLRAGIG